MGEERPEPIRGNVESSLGAVTEALAHLDRSLACARFADSVESYERMSEVVISQRLWVEDEGIEDFDEMFQRIGRLARRIHDQIEPYVEVMRTLTTLEGTLTGDSEIDPESTAGRILQALAEADPRTLSIHRLRVLLGEPRDTIEEALEDMVEKGLVRRSGRKARPVYRVVS